MFESKTFIDAPHKVVLEQVIRQRPIITAQLASRLYEAALGSFQNGGKIAPPASTAWSFVQNAEGHIVASATDMITGIYVQLSGKPGANRDLTVGQKWAVQGTNPVVSQSEIKVW